MTFQTSKLIFEPATPRSESFRVACFALMVGNTAFVVGALLGNNWITDAGGQPNHTDFTNVYAAGRLVRNGEPAAAYDWTTHHLAENALIGHDSAQYFGWHYPPSFLVIAGLLAFLPYATAFVVWIAATLLLYLSTIRVIVGDNIGWLLAGAFPCLMPNVITGQNGFLTASLIGGFLILLQQRPILAGVCLGLLTYKPQFLMLFPVVLLAGGCWNAIIAAALTFAGLVLATIAIFELSVWVAFFHWLPLTSQALLSQDHAEWYKLQSLFALVRMLGGDATLAWALQLALTGTLAGLLGAMWWNKRIHFELKASALAVAVPLATPYVYLYDLTVLGVSAAFLIRSALATGFIRGEILGLAVIMVLFLIMPFLNVPVGLITSAILALLIVRRVILNKVVPESTALSFLPQVTPRPS
jgi:arabinofuranan 3-O-arabinosyltransferase